MSKMTRISDITSEHLEQLSRETGKTRQALIEEAIEKLSRSYFLHKANKAYATLRRNKKASKEAVAERELWDLALHDGLSDE